MTRGLFTLAILVVCAAGLVGCVPAGQPKAKVTGQVSIDGEPVQRGVISFVHVNGSSPTSGAEVKNGRYDADVFLGEMIVKLSYPKVTGKKKLYDTNDSPVIDLTTEMIPERYNQKSDLKVSVQSGANVHDFILKSK